MNSATEHERFAEIYVVCFFIQERVVRIFTFISFAKLCLLIGCIYSIEHDYLQD